MKLLLKILLKQLLPNLKSPVIPESSAFFSIAGTNIAPSEETEPFIAAADEHVYEIKEKLPEPGISQGKKLFSPKVIERLRDVFRSSHSSKNKKITLFVIIILTGIFIWSVVLGNERGAKDAFLEHASKQEQIINSKLDEAREMSSFNIKKSLLLVQEAEIIYQELDSEAKAKKFGELGQLSNIKNKIEQMKQKVDKSETGKAENFTTFILLRILRSLLTCIWKTICSPYLIAMRERFILCLSLKIC